MKKEGHVESGIITPRGGEHKDPRLVVKKDTMKIGIQVLPTCIRSEAPKKYRIPKIDQMAMWALERVQ